MKTFFFIMLLMISLTAHANNLIDFNKIPLTDAIRVLANMAHRNVIISPSIKGSVSLHLHQATAESALDFLIKSQGLSYWEVADMRYIATAAEVVQRQNQARLSLRYWRLAYARAEDLAKIVSPLLSKRGALQIDARTNIIYAEDGEPELKQINSLITRLDVKTPQIAISVRLASVDVDFEQELGVSFTALANYPDSKRTQNKNTEENVSGQYSLAVVKLADHSVLDVKLSALENAGKAALISSPRLFTTNLQPASIEAGEEVPYQAVSLSGGTAVDFKKAVLGLKVTPQVLPNATLLLTIQVNQDRPSNKMVQGMPTISTRQLASTILAKSGETIVLGGIYELNNEMAERGLPYISHIPVIGWLFKQRNIRVAKRELLIFVTPTLL